MFKKDKIDTHVIDIVSINFSKYNKIISIQSYET